MLRLTLSCATRRSTARSARAGVSSPADAASTFRLSHLAARCPSKPRRSRYRSLVCGRHSTPARHPSIAPCDLVVTPRRRAPKLTPGPAGGHARLAAPVRSPFVPRTLPVWGTYVPRSLPDRPRTGRPRPLRMCRVLKPFDAFSGHGPSLTRVRRRLCRPDGHPVAESDAWPLRPGRVLTFWPPPATPARAAPSGRDPGPLLWGGD